MNHRWTAFHRLLTTCLAAGLLLSNSHSGAEEARPRPTCIILMIGDGMGASQRALATALLRARGNDPEATLHMDALPVHGAIRTTPHGGGVTDSAAGGTALATGYKTANGVIAMDPAKARPYRTLAEIAKGLGWRVGIVSSVSLDHATPACFYAHQPSRKDYAKISRQLVASSVDLFGGGGLIGQKGADGVDHLEQAREKGFVFLRTPEALAAARPAPRIWAMNHRLASEAALPDAKKTEASDLSLAQITTHALRLLDNETGVFLMVEGGKIDWMCHNNDLAGTAAETLAFDAAVAAAAAWCRSHADRAMLAVTADHETGGLTAIPAGGTDITLLDRQPGNVLGALDKAAVSLKKEAAEPATAAKALQRVLAITDLAADEAVALQDAWTAFARATEKQAADACKKALLKAGRTAVEVRAGYRFMTGGHTGVPVPVTAVGPGSEALADERENSEMAQALIQLMTGERFAQEETR